MADLQTFTLEDLEAAFARGQKLIVINGDVVDVTDYLDEHPGGGAIIEELQLHDSTVRFDDQMHTAYAEDQMKQLIIGRVARGVSLPDPDEEERKARAGARGRNVGKERLEALKRKAQIGANGDTAATTRFVKIAGAVALVLAGVAFFVQKAKQKQS